MRNRERRDPASIALTIFGVLVFVFLFLPIATIVAYSFNEGRLIAAWKGFGTGAYSAAFHDPTLKHAVKISLLSGVGASIVATILGTLCGIALARSKQRARWAVIVTIMLAITLVTPEIVDAISILPWFVTLGTSGGIAPLNNGLVRLIIVHTTVGVAVVTFIVRARMSGMDELVEEAAADLYATPWNRFRQITLPLAWPAILAGALMSFTLSLDNTIVSSFVQVPGYTSFPVYVFSLVKVGLKPEIAAMSTVLLGLTLAALVVVGLVLRRGGNSSSEVAATMAGG